MIGLPFNDLRCLGSITEVVAELVTNQDPVIVEIARKHRSTAALASYIRGLPQRDDDGEPGDGPKVETCEPPQRLRIPAPDPNCVERAALYLAVGELIDPRPVRQLATLDTPIGLHTFPIENGAPIVLDPRVSAKCLDCGVALTGDGPVAIEARDAIEWTAQLAEAGAVNTRNGPSRVRRARNAVMRLVDEGTAPADDGEVDAIGWMFAIAERAARRYGSRAIAMVRSTAQAIADIADEAIARTSRNLALDLGGGVRLQAPGWLSPLATAAARVGLVEQELNREGLTLGPIARPPKLPTFASMNGNSSGVANSNRNGRRAA